MVASPRDLTKATEVALEQARGLQAALTHNDAPGSQAPLTHQNARGVIAAHAREAAVAENSTGAELSNTSIAVAPVAVKKPI